jgi:hypothetical protein
MELGIYFWSKLHRVGHDLTLRYSHCHLLTPRSQELSRLYRTTVSPLQSNR